MIYTPDNCMPQSIVVSMPDARQLEQVFSIDSEKKEIVRYEQPFRVVDDEAVTFTKKFNEVVVTNHPKNGIPHFFEIWGLQP